MLLSEAKRLLEENGYIVEKPKLNEDIMSFAGDAISTIGNGISYFMPGLMLICVAKAFFRALGSHFDTKKIKEILKKCEENKEEFAEELIELLNKKIIHRPLNQLNDAELAEAIEKLLNQQCGYHSIHIDNDDLNTHTYNDEGYGTIKNKIISKLDEVYKILYQLFYNLIKYKLTNNSKYEDYIYNCCEKLYYMTTTIGNLKRASYLASKGTVSDDKTTKNFKKYIDNKTFKNWEFNTDGSYKIRKPYKNNLNSIKPSAYTLSDSDYNE